MYEYPKTVDLERPEYDGVKAFDTLVLEDGVPVVVWAVEPVDALTLRAFVRPVKGGAR